MCDHHNNSSLADDFYEHYMQEHALMTQYFQGLHENLSKANSSKQLVLRYQGCYPSDTWNHTFNYFPQSSSYYNALARQTSSSHTSSSNYSSENSSSTSSNYELEEECDYEDDSESEYSYELNVDAIIAMRAAKEEISANTKASTSESEKSDSIVIVDSDKEEFEFVNLDNMDSLSSKLFQGFDKSNRNKEIKTQKKVMEYLYGEKSSTIAGLETAMSLSFERLYDIHQPSLWPVLPVRL